MSGSVRERLMEELRGLEVRREEIVRELGTGVGKGAGFFPVLVLDFDGVLHEYRSKWVSAEIIPDGMVAGAGEFLAEAVTMFRVMIISSRSSQSGGIAAMRAWLLAQGVSEEIVAKIDFPLVKPPAHVTIDDRAITFMGTFPAPKDLLKFKPWNKISRTATRSEG